MISTEGGEAIQLTNSETKVLDFHWPPAGDKIVYIATEPKTDREKAMEKKGFDFIFYEETLKPRSLYSVDIDSKKLPSLPGKSRFGPLPFLRMAKPSLLQFPRKT